ncbi:hydantoinase/oxoprolinase family protein [Persephonella atlantica]|uniref:Hydantoinase/oxoprolinase family protein n=1 Tax=Persephonella atlantica TaxID=2699429 RepID=A0ABS1GG68_9AQUI|nr:hydantoinase/oxoprolinase family protein [Persephonella atlantica]MBK3331914.1 hydantoinase/oxoprolinase family protein [Persephonella atlantica]
MIKVGVDTGGTFTDFVFYKEGKWNILKVLSTPHNPAEAVLEGISRIRGEESCDITHGSTVATNAVLERKGAKTAFITNRGFENLIHIGRQSRKRLYDLFYKRGEHIIPENLRLGIECRINAKGEIVQDITDADIDRIIKILKDKNVESVAVSFLFSFLNPEHEKVVKKRLSDEGFYVSASHEIVPEFREYERSITTVINSYVMPKMSEYLSDIQSNLLEKDSFRIIQSSGGVISPETAKREPVRTVLSGPAGGVVGAFYIGRMIGKDKLITFDMGGTSTDVSLIDGKIPFTTEAEISDFPIKVPMIEIHTVGAGGGSIAYMDEGGALRVGPESAGADPGPVCYGKGEKLTVTDANLYLGRLIPEFFLGGNMKIDKNRVKDFFNYYSNRWKIDSRKLAEGIISIANTKMERAVKKISIERGYDPRKLSLFTYGGAGGMHAVFLARMLEIPEVIVPKNPGIFSAFGMLLSDIIKDYSLTVMLRGDNSEYKHIQKLFFVLEEKAISDMKNEKISIKEIKLEHYLDVRYQGQSFELVVPFDRNFVEHFHRLHEKNYGYRIEDREIEIVNIRLRAVGVTEKPEIEKIEEGKNTPSKDALIGKKKVIFDGKDYDTPVFIREKLLAGNTIKGPAVIVEYSSTTVIPPGSHLHIDIYGNMIIDTFV